MKQMKDFSFKDCTLGEEYEIVDGVLKTIGDTVTLVEVSCTFQFKSGTQMTQRFQHESFLGADEEAE